MIKIKQSVIFMWKQKQQQTRQRRKRRYEMVPKAHFTVWQHISWNVTRFCNNNIYFYVCCLIPCAWHQQQKEQQQQQKIYCLLCWTINEQASNEIKIRILIAIWHPHRALLIQMLKLCQLSIDSIALQTKIRTHTF